MAGKRGKLGKLERYCISYMYRDGFNAEAIAKELGRSVDTIKKYLDDVHGMDLPSRPSPTMATREPKETLFINQSPSGRKGMSIMTKEQSEIGDAAIKRPTKQARDHCIHSIQAR